MIITLQRCKSYDNMCCGDAVILRLEPSIISNFAFIPAGTHLKMDQGMISKQRMRPHLTF